MCSPQVFWMNVQGRRPILWLALALVCYAWPASATMSTFTIDPTRSIASLAGSVTIDFGFEGGPSVAPIQSQLDFPALGASGAVIGDGSTSDGLRSSLTGTIDINQTGALLEIVGSDFSPDISGLFTPGSFLQAAPEDAEYGGAFFAADVGLGGEMAIRFSALELVATVLETSVNGDRLDFGIGSIGDIGFTSGVVMFRTDLGGFFGAGERALATGPGVTSLEGGHLIETSPGQGELMLPFAIAFSLDEAELGLGLPMTMDLQIQGTLVATGAIDPIPEPGPALLLGLGLGLLSARNARRGL